MRQSAQANKERIMAQMSPRQRLAHRILYLGEKYRRGTLPNYKFAPDEKAFVTGLPRSPYTSGRFLFMAQKLRAIAEKSPPGSKISEAFVRVSAEWKALPEHQRAIYEREAKKDQERYAAELKAYLSK